MTSGALTPAGENIIDVIATRLDFVVQPGATAGINEPTTPAIVNARDLFGVVDTEFNFAATLSTPAATPVGVFVFVNGVLNLSGLQYSSPGNGTLTVTSNGLSSNTSVQCTPVDVFDVTTAIATNGVVATTNLAAGATDQVILA